MPSVKKRNTVYGWNKNEPHPLWSGRASSRSRLALRRLIVSTSHGDRRPQRRLFAVEDRLQQFTRWSFRRRAFTDRDQHPDRQSVDPPIPFLLFPPMPDLGIQPRAPTPTAYPPIPFCSPESRHTA